MAEAGRGPVVTEVAPAGEFYFAEEHHQQYLHKVPNGYCGLQGTGVSGRLPGSEDRDDPLDAATSETGDHGLKPVATTDEEWRRRLTPEQYEVLRLAGTERPFTGAYNDTDEPGVYRCMACGNVLFTSDTKFHSGCGWPSFTETVSPDAVQVIEDTSLGMVRTEVRCARCESHLGHVFPDGPADRGGLRYCMNSVALDLEEEGTA